MRWPHTCMLVGAIVLGCAAFAPELAGARPERRDAPERAHRTGRRSHAEHPEALLQAYKQFYVLPRAYPDSLIDPSARPRAFRQLQAMRDTLHIPYAPPPGLLAPIGVRTQPCAWRSIGPTNVNGRVTGIAIDPTNRDHMWVTTMGGIWRSLDRGRSWQCVSYEAGPGSTCDLQSGAFGAVAVNPANTSEVFAGGGDPNYTAYAGGGPGLWRSVADGDAKTWKCEPVGFASTAVVRRIRVDRPRTRRVEPPDALRQGRKRRGWNPQGHLRHHQRRRQLDAPALLRRRR